MGLVGWAMVGLASAHTGEPASMEVVLHPVDAGSMVVRTTYGLLISEDDGYSWRWTCGSIAAFDPTSDQPPIHLFASGRLAVASYVGLVDSLDGGCSWAFAPDPLPHKFWRAIDVRGPDSVAVVNSSGRGGWQYTTTLYASDDSGDTWSEWGQEVPADLRVTDLASDGDTVYLTGDDGPGEARTPVLLRSADGGDSWERLPLPGGATVLDSQVVVDPVQPGRIHLLQRLDEASGAGGKLYRSDDRGDSFTERLSTDLALWYVAPSPDGGAVAVGGPDEGLHLVADGGSAVSAPVSWVACLVWDDSGMYVCGDQLQDGFSLGRSVDGGATFSSLMNLESACEPIHCAVDSPSESLCEPEWAEVQERVGGTLECPPEVDEPEPEPDTDTEVPHTDDETDDTPPSDPSCGCATRPGPALPGLLGLMVWGWARRRPGAGGA